MMKMSENGAKVLIMREGLRTKAYKDTKGIWTIGVGHTGPEVVEELVITKEKAHELFRKDVAWAEDAVNLVKVPLTQNQFDALVSFVFNVGAGAWKRSTMLKLLNAGDYVGASKQFDRWVIPIEITSRRMSEKAQFNS
jgi:lysozyme